MSDVHDLPDLVGLRVTVADRIAWVTIDNGPINILDVALLVDFHRLATWLGEQGDAVRGPVVLDSGEPGVLHFAPRPRRAEGAMDAENKEDPAFQQFVARFRALDQVTVAVVAGRVAGGGNELLMNLDLRFAVRGRAVFNQIETGLGVVPGGSGSQHLLLQLGRARALEAILGHDDFDADLAERYGWVIVRSMTTRSRPSSTGSRRGSPASPCRCWSPRSAPSTRRRPTLRPVWRPNARPSGRPSGTKRTRRLLRAALAAGAETIEGERRLGDLVGELPVEP